MSWPDTLPIRVQPMPGEALDSWLAALAYRLHTPLVTLLPELGLPRPRQNNRHSYQPGDIPMEWSVLLRPWEIGAIAAATCIDPDTIDAMTLRRYHGVALLIDSTTRRVNVRRLWGRNTASRFCPDCLAETGGRWLLSWRLGWSFACMTHRRLLADVCPGCGRIPRRRLLGELSVPGRCAQPAGPGARGRFAARCGHDLTTATTLRLPHDHPVLHAQRLIDEIIDRGEASFGVYAIKPLPTITALSDLRALAGRILTSTSPADLPAPPEDLLAAYTHALAQPGGHHRPAPIGNRHAFLAPPRAEITALAATIAVSALGASTVREAGTSLRWLMETARRRGRATHPTNVGTWGRGTSTTLKSIQVSALAPFLSPSDQLRYRASAADPHCKLPASGASARHYHVPTMIWTSWALRLQPDKSFYLHTLRSACLRRCSYQAPDTTCPLRPRYSERQTSATHPAFSARCMRIHTGPTSSPR